MEERLNGIQEVGGSKSPVSTTLKKRTWCYVQRPVVYEMAPCTCGNHNTEWSEFERHLWCDVCKIDFIPAHAGVFDGPIPVATAGLLGMSFDRYNLETNQIEPFNVEAS